MQMIRGGTAAVLVMPTGDGGRRCCSDRTLAQFSLGLVCLKNGINNLYPVVQPFPDWQAFVDEGSPESEPVSEQDQETTKSNENDQLPSEIPTDNRGSHDRQRIVNAVDAFLDDRGRILWVLDVGRGGEDACYGNTPPPSSDRSASEAETDDQLLQPKFIAIDVYTNQVHNNIDITI